MLLNCFTAAQCFTGGQNHLFHRVRKKAFTRKWTNKLNPELLLTSDCFWITVAMKLTTSQTPAQDVARFCFCLLCQTDFGGCRISFFFFPSVLTEWRCFHSTHTRQQTTVWLPVSCSVPLWCELTTVQPDSWEAATGEWHKMDQM